MFYIFIFFTVEHLKFTDTSDSAVKTSKNEDNNFCFNIYIDFFSITIIFFFLNHKNNRMSNFLTVLKKATESGCNF